MREEMDFKMYHLLCNLFDEVMHVKADLRDTYHQFPRHNFPKTNVPGVVDFLLRKLMDMLKYNPISIAPVKHQIQTIIGDLKFFRSFLRDVVEQDIENQQVQDLGARVINMVYEIEYLLEDTGLLKIQSREIYERKAADIIVPKVTQASQREISQSSVPQIDEIVVELHDQEQAIFDRLTWGSLQRDLVAIVGMPGIGKTTMAKEVFNDPKISYNFHVCAWCHVSQVYNKRNLLLDILSSISKPNADTLQMGNADLELMLYQKLKQKRNLIVVDDMWNTGTWDDLEKSLPSDRNGSRILITSRLHDVALKAKPDSKPHSLRLLSDSESWDLLQSKIFHDQDCPAALSEIGMQISRSCGGLPLAIVAIAGVLERTDRTRDWWHQIAESMSSHIFDNPEMQCKVIVELSYKHLPDHLRPCFLYFGIFWEQKDILV
ncbi:putative late blight resistance protein homolog R1C-3 [Coffea eugenioides]|uniref:putative late blight resistance protein homolog R1C-3 n=1 Tax=Coffea eugenioides TaxID=49369 RepID=UPI000F608A46|nr:putative late blight resistance protein homolog R1C-3 [Coffea eugenioides]